MVTDEAPDVAVERRLLGRAESLKVLVMLTSLGAGGTERSTALLLPHLSQHGIDAEVAVLQRTDLGDEAAVSAQGFAVHLVGGRSRLGQVLATRRLIGKVDPDVIHTAIFDADIVGRVAGKLTRTPVLSSLVNTSYDPARLADSNVPRWKLRVAQQLDGFTARHLTTRIHAVSEGVADANVRDLGLDRSRISVVERGRNSSLAAAGDPSDRSSVRRSLGIDENSTVLLAVGRQEYQKGHEVLVRAVAHLNQRHGSAPVVALVAGREGNATESLVAEIGASSARDAVRLLGHRDDVPALLRAADYFVLPSHYEGTAGAALEAMAARIPIVASDVDGLRGVLDHDRNSVLVSTGDPVALADAIRWLATDAQRRDRLTNAAESDFSSRFTLPRAAERMAALYRDVAAEARR